MKKNSPISEQQHLHRTNFLSSAASQSLTDLIQSLSQEQTVNQDLLLSLSFALRSFTNLQRFLELVPLLVTQLVGVKGALLIPFQDNGSLWREQLQMLPAEEDQELFRKLFLLEEGMKAGFGIQEKNIAALDRLVQRHFDAFNVISTSALDPEMISEVLDVMIELAREGITMICVTHEMGFARKVANRIIFMDDGQIVEENDPENFFNNAESDRLQLFLNQILTH